MRGEDRRQEEKERSGKRQSTIRARGEEARDDIGVRDGMCVDVPPLFFFCSAQSKRKQ